MYVITVIPIARGIGKEVLSYFTATKTEIGALVSVPLRKKMIEALVVRSVDAREMKTEIRSLYATGKHTQSALAERFGCDQTYISLIVKKS